MVVHLKREYPAEANKMGEQWLRELIREGITTAEGYHITLEDDVARYLEFMLALSPDFDESPKTPWVQEILSNDQLTGEEKLDRIDEHIMFEPEEDEAPEAVDADEEDPVPFEDDAEGVPEGLTDVEALEDDAGVLDGRELFLSNGDPDEDGETTP
jgi:hypothetical protein